MSILKYLERKDGFPDPNGALSRSIAPRAISAANKEIEKVAHSEKRKRGVSNRFIWHNIYIMSHYTISVLFGLHFTSMVRD